MTLEEIRELLGDYGSRLRDEAARLRRTARPRDGNEALTAFIRPNLGRTPEPLRRILEPVVAAAAALALAVLLSFGMFSFAGFFVAATLIYAIITYVFGIELDLNLPS